MNNDINAQVAEEPRITALRSYVRRLLEPRMGLIVDGLTDHIFNLSASAQLTPDGRTECFETFATLRKERRALVDGMLDRIDADFEKLVEVSTEKSADDIKATELNLVDLEEFENSLAIDRIVQAGSQRNWLQLEAITLRLAQIVDQDPLKLRLPFGLRGLCAAYRSVLKAMDIPVHILTELDRAFARSVLPEVDAVYRAINAELVAEGLLPNLETELETSGSKLGKRDQASRQEARKSLPKEPPPSKIEGEQRLRSAHIQPESRAIPERPTLPNSAPAGGSGQRTSDGLGTPYLSDMPPREMPSLQQAPPPPQRPTSFLESSAPFVAPSPLEEAAGAAGSADFLPGRGSQALHTTVDTGTLERLRGPTIADGDDFTPLTPTELAAQAQGFVNQIAELRQQGVTAAAGPEALITQLGLDSLGPEAAPLRGSVQLVDNLYRTMLDTLPISEGLSESLHILKLPLAQLALLDPDFFHNREHPARLLIERLSEVSALAPKNSARVEKRIDQVLNDVNAEYSGDVDVFDKALAQVTELALTMLRQQQKSIQRQVAAEDGKEKRQRAQHLVEEALVAQLPDTTLPGSVLNLVDNLLRDDLTLRLLRDGESQGYTEVLDQLRALSEILIRVADGDEPVDASRATREMENLRARIDNAQFLSPEQDAVLQQLELELAGVSGVELQDSTLGDHELFEEPAFSQRLSRLPRLRRWVKRARDLKLNTWLTETLPDGAVRNLQLIWRNESNTRFAFANEQGQKLRDLNLVELARWLDKRLRPLSPAEQLSIIEKSVFTSLEQKQNDLASLARPTWDNDLTRADLVDRVQSMLRRARRKGPSHCALAIHADDPQAVAQVQVILNGAGFTVETEGPLSPSTRGVIVEAPSVDDLQATLQEKLQEAESAGIGIARIDADQSSAEDLWRSVEETAKRGLTLSPNKGLVAEQEARPTDLASSVRKTYARLKEDMPPRFALRSILRSSAQNPDITETLFQILLDGSADTGGDVAQQTGYHSVALSIALDCCKVNMTCQFAEQLARAGREIPVFNLRLSTDAALHPEFLDFVLNEVSESGIGTDRLCIELKDSARLREESRVADFSRTLRSIGCHIAVCDVHPSRGSTSELQLLSPHMLALDASLWPDESSESHMPALHQAISDLHHLVGEQVVLRGPAVFEGAAELGIDFIENINPDELDADALTASLPLIQR